MTMTINKLTLDGKHYVIMTEAQYEVLAKAAIDSAGLPDLPLPDENGNVPAIETARLMIARDLISRRKSLGLSQTKLAELSGVEQATISRIEAGKVTAAVKTIDTLTDAMDRLAKRDKD